MMGWTDDFSFYLSPVSDELLADYTKGASALLGSSFDIHSAKHWPSLDGAHLVLLGVSNRGTAEVIDADGPDAVRREFYKLFKQHTHLNLVDLGNIAAGETVRDTEIALTKVIGGLALRKTLVVILGGSQALTYANYAAYEALESTVNVAIVDAEIDMGEYRETLSDRNYLSKIVVHKPSYLFNLSVLGYQNYLNDPENITLMDKLYFDALRLGEIRADIRCVEPHLRQADILSIDINAIAHASAPGSLQPNGLNGEEICRLCRYAGLSDNCSSVGIYNYMPSRDTTALGARLIAQMIWHVIDGLGSRVKEYPVMNKSDFLEYKVQLPDVSEHITFYKSKRTEKWWMNVPYEAGDEHKVLKHHLIPCNYREYETAASGEIPDLWWRTYRKLT